MKLLKREYTPIKGCNSFFSWLWFTADYPLFSMYGDDTENWFKHCGSDNRVLIRRRFGWSTDYGYNRNEFGFLYSMLFLVAVVGVTWLLTEIGLILLINNSH